MQNKSDKRVVIVGASYAGFTLAEYFWNDYRVILIDKKDHWEYVASTLKSSIDPTWHTKNLIKFSEVVKGHGQRFEFI